MRIAVIAFSGKGGALAKQIASLLPRWRMGEMHQVRILVPETHKTEAVEAFDSLDCVMEEIFRSSGMIVFVGACGIAVRAIAPYIRSKLTDPGVLVTDECGDYVIPILSGHIGGANEFGRWLADAIGAEPVITTATDRNGVFAVDTFAVKNHLYIENPSMIKEVSSGLLNGQKVGVISEFPIQGHLPQGLILISDRPGNGGIGQKLQTGIRIGTQSEDVLQNLYFERACVLTPVDLVAGMGCRRGKSAVELEFFLKEILKKHHINIHRIGKLCSVDKKADEQGLIGLADRLGIPFETYSAAELNAIPGEDGAFSNSDFVREQTGTENVCERSACLGSGHGRKLIAKQTMDGMTLAVYQREMQLMF